MYSVEFINCYDTLNSEQESVNLTQKEEQLQDQNLEK